MAQNKLPVQSDGTGAAATLPGVVCDIRLELRKLRPLLPVSFCSVLFDKNFLSIAADCESGFFRFSFNISTSGAARSELRILRDCVLYRLNPCWPEPKTLPDVFDLILPHRGIRGTELQRILGCAHQHVSTLDSASLIQVERERLAADGPNSSRVYSRQSIVDFLSSRFLGDPTAN